MHKKILKHIATKLDKLEGTPKYNKTEKQLRKIDRGLKVPPRMKA